MFLKIYTIYDSKTETYMTPVFEENKGTAVRKFIQAVNSDDTFIAQYPEDFTLFELGEFDRSTSKFSLYETSVSIGKAIEFVKDK